MKKWFNKKFENRKSIMLHILTIIIIGEIVAVLTPLSLFSFNNIILIGGLFPFLCWLVLPLAMTVNVGIANSMFINLLMIIYWPILVFLIVKIFKKKEKIFFVLFSIIYIFSCYGAGIIMREWTKY